MYWIFDFYYAIVMCLACQLKRQHEYNTFFSNLSSLTSVWSIDLGLVTFSFGGLGL